MEFLRSCMFIGIEAEGDFRGTKTLFVADRKATYFKILKAAKKYKVENIYFGAGGLYALPDKVYWEHIRRLAKEFKIVLEIDNPARYSLIPPEVYVILNLPLGCMPSALKYDFPQANKSVTFLVGEQGLNTPYDDPLYQEDMKIED